MLIAWLSSDERNQAVIAKALKVSRPSVHAWVNGVSRPRPHLRQALEALTGIPPAEWELQAEKAQRADAIDRIRKAESDHPPASERRPNGDKSRAS